MNLPDSVFDYLHLSSEEKIALFLQTNTYSNRPADFYIDFGAINPHIDPIIERLNKLSKELHANSVAGVKEYFSLHPDQLILIPSLLAMRPDANLEVLGKNAKDSDYELDFAHPENTIPEFNRFLEESGLAQFLATTSIVSFADLARGIEIGINTNARKNRGGKLGEDFLEQQLSRFATPVTDNKSWKNPALGSSLREFSFVNQGTINGMQRAFDIDLSDSTIPKNRRFDGAVYRKSTNQLTLLEVNFFNGGGSKLKAVAGEFEGLQTILNNGGFRFIYITSGYGWKGDVSHISDAITKIKYLFNFEMVKKGYITQLLSK